MRRPSNPARDASRTAAPGAGPARSLAVGVVVVCLAVAGCATAIQGTPTTALDTINTTDVGGLPITDGPNGPRAGVPAATLPLRGGTDGAMDRLAVDSLADIYRYWRQAMPADFGNREFHAPTTLHSYDSRVAGPKLCGQPSEGLVNAFYCANDNSVSWDRGRLLPLLSSQFGQNAVLAVLAHEVGHAVASQLGSAAGVTPTKPTLVAEQQADCFAGSFFRWAAAGHAPHFQVSTGVGLNKITSTLLFIRDPSGELSSALPGAHGTAFDRIYAFQLGFTNTPRTCAGIDAQSVAQRSTEKLFTSAAQQASEGNIDVLANLALLRASVTGAFPELSWNAPGLSESGARCAASSGTPPVSYCARRRLIALNPAGIAALATPADPEPSGTVKAGGGIGDFAAFGAIVSRYTLAVQRRHGMPITGARSGLVSACLTGAWAAYTTHRHGNTRALRLAPGDLDEAIAELLRPHSVIASGADGKSTESGFARVAAFRVGFLLGAEHCR